jgi:hypothetical protein
MPITENVASLFQKQCPDGCHTCYKTTTMVQRPVEFKEQWPVKSTRDVGTGSGGFVSAGKPAFSDCERRDWDGPWDPPVLAMLQIIVELFVRLICSI